MRHLRHWIFSALLAFCGYGGVLTAPVTWAQKSPLVIAVLVDGLSGEMIAAFDTPHLDQLRAAGVYSNNLIPTFPAISGPTWVSISTGCRPDKHGLVTDKFWDPALGLMDHSGDVKWLAGCELLQQTAERQGVITAALGWWGQWSEEHGKTASYISAGAQAEQSVPRDSLLYLSDAERSEEVVRYLSLPLAEKPQLILAYFRGPDHDAHWHGIRSPQNQQAVETFDRAMGGILDAIGFPDSRNAVSLFIFSDHGHVPVDRIVNVKRILRRHDIAARDVTSGTTGFIYLQDRDTVEQAIEVLSQYSEMMDVLDKRAFPDYVNLGDSDRVPDIILAAKPGYFMADPDLWPWYLKPLTVIGPSSISSPPFPGAKGLYSAHGYQPNVPGNSGIFLGWGKELPAGLTLPAMDMVDIHPTIAEILRIEPGADIDGRSLLSILRQPGVKTNE